MLCVCTCECACVLREGDREREKERKGKRKKESDHVTTGTLPDGKTALFRHFPSRGSCSEAHSSTLLPQQAPSIILIVCYRPVREKDRRPIVWVCVQVLSHAWLKFVFSMIVFLQLELTRAHKHTHTRKHSHVRTHTSSPSVAARWNSASSGPALSILNVSVQRGGCWGVPPLV